MHPKALLDACAELLQQVLTFAHPADAVVSRYFRQHRNLGPRERAALAWAEEVTRVSETHASDEAYAAALAVFGEKDLVDLTLTIATMNAINRMGVSFRMKPRAKA